MNIIEGIVSIVGILSITFISICLIYAKYYKGGMK